MNPLKKAIIFLILGVAALLIPGTIIKSFYAGWVVPNFVMMLVVFLAFYRGLPGDALLVFLLGLEQDLASLSLLGPWAGAYTVVFAVLTLFSRRIFIESGWVVFITVYAATLAADGIYLGMLSLVYGSLNFSSASLTTSLWEGLLSAACAPLIFSWLRRTLIEKETEARYLTPRASSTWRSNGGRI